MARHPLLPLACLFTLCTSASVLSQGSTRPWAPPPRASAPAAASGAIRLVTAAALTLVASVGGIAWQPQAAPADQFFDLRERFFGLGAGVAPDLAMAAGWQHLVVARNFDIALFRKSAEPTRRLAATSIADLFRRLVVPGDRIADPFLLFDRDDGRFFFVVAQTNRPLAMLMAVSKSAYPETLTENDWYVYRLPRNDDADDADFDKLAVAGNALLVSWQRVSEPASGPVSLGIRIRVYDKRPLMTGAGPVGLIDLNLAATPNYRARPAAVDTPRDRQVETDRVFYDIYRSCGSTNRETWLIGAVTGVGTSPRLDTREVVSPFACQNTPVFAPQTGGRQVKFPHIATNPVYHDGHLWLFEPAGGSTPQALLSVEWIELDVRGWPDAVRIVQSGTFTDPGVWAYVPSAAVDWDGNLVMAYARSGANEYPSAYYTGRLAADPQGLLRSGRPLTTGTRAWMFGSNFLDFSATTIDPSDGSVWISGSVPTPTPPAGGTSPENQDMWVGRLSLPTTSVPGAPTEMTASATGSSVTLVWSAPVTGGAPTAYIIEAGSNAGAANLANFSTGTTATSFSASGIGSGSYFVRVRATNLAGTSAASNEAILIVGGSSCTVPGAPSGLSAVAVGGGTVVLSWMAAAGSPTSYLVEAGSTPGASNLANSDLGSPATSLTATGVGAGTYFVRMRAKNACGTSAGASNEVALVVK